MSRTGCPRVLWPANSTERDICFIRDFHKIFIRLGYRHQIIITRTMQLVHIIKVLFLNIYVRTLYSFPFLNFNLFTTVIKIPSTITSKNIPTQQQFSLFYNLVSTYGSPHYLQIGTHCAVRLQSTWIVTKCKLDDIPDIARSYLFHLRQEIFYI